MALTTSSLSGKFSGNLTSDDIIAKLRAASSSQIKELLAGKIKTYKAVKDRTGRSLIVDSTGHIAEVASLLDGQPKPKVVAGQRTGRRGYLHIDDAK
ncbi:hypothetical protein [Bradyrhizobium sp. 191]|uniref:hypothetical protein n=1 Tax=Bradyrhizobium sp. 191 TaxID=2782659 RepID=UPI001FFEC933|nr:hypothetical protein [Bradyrhizobium sp. 191]UPJ63668.1 hypothetical protein IVB23_27140 [Bradyrhizobium sp. 191]